MLTDFYKHGFNTPERNSALKNKYPDRFILNAPSIPATASAVSTTWPRTVTVQGRMLSAGSLGAYLRNLRNVTVNIEFNGALCRGLLAARFGEEQPEEDGPGLRHFVREAARAASGDR